MIKFPPIEGLEIIVNDIACISKEWKQYRFPKTKKSRIRKKWAKRSENFRMKDVYKAIQIDRKLIISSVQFEQLKKLIPEK